MERPPLLSLFQSWRFPGAFPARWAGLLPFAPLARPISPPPPLSARPHVKSLIFADIMLPRIQRHWRADESRPPVTGIGVSGDDYMLVS
jgi:hypothetical protein